MLAKIIHYLVYIYTHLHLCTHTHSHNIILTFIPTLHACTAGQQRYLHGESDIEQRGPSSSPTASLHQHQHIQGQAGTGQGCVSRT